MSGGLFLSFAEVSSSPCTYAWPVTGWLYRKERSMASLKPSLVPFGDNTNHMRQWLWWICFTPSRGQTSGTRQTTYEAALCRETANFPKKCHHYHKAFPDYALNTCVIVTAMTDKWYPWHSHICGARCHSASVFFGLVDPPFWVLKSTKIFLDVYDNQAGYRSHSWWPAYIYHERGNLLYLGWQEGRDIKIHMREIKHSSEWLAHVLGCPQATNSLVLE